MRNGAPGWPSVLNREEPDRETLLEVVPAMTGTTATLQFAATANAATRI